MELVDVIKQRHSVRKCQEKEVPQDLVQQILELAKSAPSAGNLKSYDVLVTKEKITSQADAPIYLIICANPEKSATRYGDRGRYLYSIQDATIFGSYIQLIAVDKGLCTVWIGAFREEKIKRMFNLKLRPIAIIAMGYKEV